MNKRLAIVRVVCLCAMSASMMASTCITTPDDSEGDSNLIGTWDYEGEYTVLPGSYFCGIQGVLDLTGINVNPGVQRGSFMGRVSCQRDVSGPIWQPFQDRVSYSVEGNSLWMLFESGELCEQGGEVQKGQKEVLGSMQAITINYCGAPGRFRMFNRR